VAREMNQDKSTGVSAQADVIEAREEVARAGEQIYEQNLRSLLEPATPVDLS